MPVTLRESMQWGVSRGMINVPPADPLAKLIEDMSTALREEYATDASGRRYRVNHAVRVTKGGVQYTFWAIMNAAPRQHMQKAFIQRREQIVGDCVQLATGFYSGQFKLTHYRATVILPLASTDLPSHRPACPATLLARP